MPPRLKVFVTSDGLTEFVVAASSKTKALAAWGVHQDVFKTGLAQETDDPELTEAAIAKPGEVLRRPAQTRAELASLKPAARPKLRPQAKLEPELKGPSKAALKKVADLEARLAALDADHDREAAKLAHERAALDRRAEALQADHAARRDKLQAALSAARRALG